MFESKTGQNGSVIVQAGSNANVTLDGMRDLRAFILYSNKQSKGR